MGTPNPPGPVKLNASNGLNIGLQKVKSSAKKPIVTYKPGINYGKKP
jgi:hypothetical protein